MNKIENAISVLKTELQSITSINYIQDWRANIDKFVTAEIVRNGFAFNFERGWNNQGIINTTMNLNIYANVGKEIELQDIVMNVLEKLTKNVTLSDTCRVTTMTNAIIDLKNENLAMLCATINLDLEIQYDF